MDPGAFRLNPATPAPRPLHVAVVTETYPPEINGVAMTLGRMVAGLIARGHRVTLTRPRQRHEDRPAPRHGLATHLVRGVPIPGYRGLRFGLPAKGLLLRQWRDDPPDVVQVVTEGPLGASAVAAARSLDIPVVSEFHTNFHSYCGHYGLGWLRPLVAAHLRRIHNRAQMTLVPSHALRGELLGAGYRRVRTVARGVDAELFHPGRRSEALRRHWEARPGGLVVIHVGRLAPEKNLGLVFSAFDAIARESRGARLVLVGDGPSRVRLEREHPRHQFVGMRRGEDLAAHYASADLFLFPSLTETYGNVVLEALASGLPVVAFRRAAAAELIRHGDNGMLAADGDAAAFVAHAVELARRPGLLATARARAWESASGLGWEAIHDRLVTVLREAIALNAVADAMPPRVARSTVGG